MNELELLRKERQLLRKEIELKRKSKSTKLEEKEKDKVEPEKHKTHSIPEIRRSQDKREREPLGNLPTRKKLAKEAPKPPKNDYR